MKSNFLKAVIRPIMLVAILGLAFTVLAGCGIGHDQYRYGNNGYHGAGSADDFRNSDSYGTMYGPDGKDYHRHAPGYRDGRGGYCGW